MKLSRLALYAVALFGIAILGAKDSGAAETGAEIRALLEESASLVEESVGAAEAQRMREQLGVFSDDELLDVYAEVDLEGLLEAQIKAAEAYASAQAAEILGESTQPGKLSVSSRRPLQDDPLAHIDWYNELGSGDGTTHSGRAKGERSDPGTSINDWTSLEAMEVGLEVAWDALAVARDAYTVCMAGGEQFFLGGGIGVCAGSNFALACAVVAGAVVGVQATFTGLDVAYQVALSDQQQVDYLDATINSAELSVLVDRTEYLNNQLIAFDNNLTQHDLDVSTELAAHDQRVKAQLNQHDLDIKEQLEQHDIDIKVMLTELERQVDLVLKTQIENMLSANGGARSGVAYLERLQEVCDLAYEAISDASAAGYIVSQTALDRWVEGNSVITTDPKRAHDYCRIAYQMASARSRRMSGG